MRSSKSESITHRLEKMLSETLNPMGIGNLPKIANEQVLEVSQEFLTIFFVFRSLPNRFSTLLQGVSFFLFQLAK